MWPVQENSPATAPLPSTRKKSGKSRPVRFREGLQRVDVVKKPPQVKKLRDKGIKLSPLAGKPAPREMLVDLARLEREYYERRPDVGDPNQLVSFGTSGHRGSPLH